MHVRLHDVEAGTSDGPLVVLLHGLPAVLLGRLARDIAPLASPNFSGRRAVHGGYTLFVQARGHRVRCRPPACRRHPRVHRSARRRCCAVGGHDWWGRIAWTTAMDDRRRSITPNRRRGRRLDGFLKDLAPTRTSPEAWGFSAVPGPPRRKNTRGTGSSPATRWKRHGRPTPTHEIERYVEAWAQGRAAPGDDQRPPCLRRPTQKDGVGKLFVDRGAETPGHPGEGA